MTTKTKTNNNDFFRNIIKGVDDDTFIASEGQSSAEFCGWIDTGSYIFNALVSSTIFGGIPNNKVTTLTGESTTGKTYFALGLMQHFHTLYPDGGILYYDTEYAVTNEMMQSRGIDINRVIRAEPITLEEMKLHCINILNKYGKSEPRPPFLIVLDSLSQLPSRKELNDSANNEVKADQGLNAKVIKGIFREIRQKLAKFQVPMIVTAHVYSNPQAYGNQKQMSGGSGPLYSSDLILELSKKKDKDDEKEVIGTIITAKNFKNRMAKENAHVSMKLSYTTGLDRYFGLLELAVRQGVVKKVGNMLQLPDGSKAFAKTIYENPEKYFTDEFLKTLDDAARREFSYGTIL